ncbi:hypothetical protein F0U47_06530 [Nocardioides antri]|uniref:Calcium-binding protein n=2 Tax=Nocardioides antri TaxID=2607659 RepID=A0A5B1M2H9_9ACTN|nr:hypothetical protein F0U47_06530 [Nocardioides antri]
MTDLLAADRWAESSFRPVAAGRDVPSRWERGQMGKRAGMVGALVAGLAVLPATAVPSASTAMTRTCGGLPATIVGTAGDDDIDGTEGDDVIVGLAGDDTIGDGGGDDVVCGNLGDDLLWSEGGDDLLIGGGGADGALVGFGRDEVHGGRGGTGRTSGAWPQRTSGSGRATTTSKSGFLGTR